eukprot:1146609-Pelagomonas_calceolata.AAC.3
MPLPAAAWSYLCLAAAQVQGLKAGTSATCANHVCQLVLPAALQMKADEAGCAVSQVYLDTQLGCDSPSNNAQAD